MSGPWGEKVHGLLSEALQADGEMLVKFVLTAEIVAADGERMVLMATSPDIRKWDALGLLAYARDVELSGSVADRIAGEDR